MKTIPLTQGFVALVDDEDFARVSAHKWYAVRKGRGVYARHKFTVLGVHVWCFLHTFILPDANRVDHKDGDGLNNQRHNLRAATVLQNNRAFKRKPRGSSSKFRGVYWPSGRKKWTAQIEVNYKRYFLGTFEKEEDAARCYDAAAREYFGDFASPNFP